MKRTERDRREARRKRRAQAQQPSRKEPADPCAPPDSRKAPIDDLMTALRGFRLWAAGVRWQDHASFGATIRWFAESSEAQRLLVVTMSFREIERRGYATSEIHWYADHPGEPVFDPGDLWDEDELHRRQAELDAGNDETKRSMTKDEQLDIAASRAILCARSMMQGTLEASDCAGVVDTIETLSKFSAARQQEMQNESFEHLLKTGYTRDEIRWYVSHPRSPMLVPGLIGRG